MASIKITERDLTTPGSTTVNTNVAYVPGYAVMGPVNEPILCSTGAEFKEIFGNVPYKFKENAMFNNAVYARVGDYEKSYIYAIELLNSGMPILFERIAATTTKASAKIQALLAQNSQSGLTITAKYPGEYGSAIHYDLKVKTTTSDKSFVSIILKDSVFRSGTKLVIDRNSVIVANDTGFEVASEITDEDIKSQIETFILNNFDGLKLIANELMPIADTTINEQAIATDIVSGSTIITYTTDCELTISIDANDFTKGVVETYNFSTDLNSTEFVNSKQFNLIDIEFDSDSNILQPANGNLVYSATTQDFTITDFMNYLEQNLTRLSDRGTYQFKFITSGSYPTYVDANNTIAKKMLAVAASRGDAIALIDHTSNADIISIHNNIATTLASDLSATGEDPMKYGAMFTPWGIYNINSLNTTVELPASFAYLKCLANSVKTNAAWNAIAGVTRGHVLDLLSIKSKITGATADILQSRTGVSINPITDIKPYGNCIWGNRTLFNNKKELTASSFLNIRMLSSDVKKKLYEIAKELTFELNSEVLWLNFKSKIIPTLDQMVSGNGLSGYKIIKTPTDKKATVACTIKLYAIEAVEDWDITIELSDSYISVE